MLTRPTTPRMRAAAPELYLACEAALEYLAPYATSDGELEAAERLRQALAAATGDPTPRVNAIIPLWRADAP